jgi:hypothetical protein
MSQDPYVYQQSNLNRRDDDRDKDHEVARGLEWPSKHPPALLANGLHCVGRSPAFGIFPSIGEVMSRVTCAEERYNVQQTSEDGVE